ncbi:adenosylcobinamide-GDP ribazoletransferase [Leptothoe sp. PORK10 BA2]|uniref:adenosylcobinamide-GDP ribazoletransferase n=1 Tax=Leptothoe sp. PORK10 BA2 TaxID=3110254 RepID=UPI002B204471|nr:adenosylcobinamide-GDP ribazoletransferase [Leptothoe sp. PORK10 BA2]MEA5462108.1 adenosylcobinamide-GDP ribazoletransferase [Leptothoe sp. PORK10 BA2]
MGLWIQAVCQAIHRQWALLNGAFLFYSCLPLPPAWPVAFDKIAWLAPGVGLALGGLLTGVDGLLGLGLPPLLRSTLVVLVGVWLTGGLHLDGAMDTADGLAVQDPGRRLGVMADSRSGAFGVMVAIAIVLLKTTALAAMTHHRWFALLSAAAWGRWGQQWAIGSYAYLKPEGKGAFHKQALPSRWHTLPWLMGLMGWTALTVALGWLPWWAGLTAVALGVISSWWVAHWLNQRLGGHTGDTYGALVEWVEVAVLVGLAGVLA